MKFSQVNLLVLSMCGFAHSFNVFLGVRDLLFPKNPTVKRVRNLGIEGRAYSEFAILDFIGLVERHGYPGEEHNVTTPDGYHLVIHRIPGSPRTQRSNGKVIFMQHGVLASSDLWVLRGPNYDLAYLLADAGYDVWLGNLRGNCYCRTHETLRATDPEFWQFSFHEHGILDLPTMIDYVLRYTGRDKLHFLGHSMGTTSLYVMLTMKPEYNEVIELGINLAPVVFWRHNRSPVLRTIVKHNKIIRTFFEKNNVNEVGPLTTQGSRIGRVLCNDKSVTQSFCVTLIFLISGVDVPQMNTSTLVNLLSYYPAGTSVKCLTHYLQHILSNEFDAYDYGPEENLVRYGQRKPPLYDLNNVTAPIALYYATNDVLSNAEDAVDLKKKLSNVVIYERVPYKFFNHMDYLWAVDSRKILYDQLLQQIQPY